MKKQSLVTITVIAVVLMSFGIGTVAGAAVCTENVLGIGMTAAAKLYYPCNISSPLPASTMSSGWTAGLAAIEWLSRPMAAQGNVVLAFTPLNRYGLVTDWQAAHTNCFNRLKQMASSHRNLAGKIDLTRMQIAGYSKGGGGSLAAAANLGGQVASVVGMAPYWGGEYNMAALGRMRAATFIQCAGIMDTLATPVMTEMEWAALPNGISKLYKRRTAYNHLDWAMGINQETIKREIFAWMDYYLNDNQTSGNDAILNNRLGVESFHRQN